MALDYYPALPQSLPLPFKECATGCVVCSSSIPLGVTFLHFSKDGAKQRVQFEVIRAKHILSMLNFSAF